MMIATKEAPKDLRRWHAIKAGLNPSLTIEQHRSIKSPQGAWRSCCRPLLVPFAPALLCCAFPRFPKTSGAGSQALIVARSLMSSVVGFWRVPRRLGAAPLVDASAQPYSLATGFSQLGREHMYPSAAATRLATKSAYMRVTASQPSARTTAHQPRACASRANGSHDAASRWESPALPQSPIRRAKCAGAKKNCVCTQHCIGRRPSPSAIAVGGHAIGVGWMRGGTHFWLWCEPRCSARGFGLPVRLPDEARIPDV